MPLQVQVRSVHPAEIAEFANEALGSMLEQGLPWQGEVRVAVDGWYPCGRGNSTTSDA